MSLEMIHFVLEPRSKKYGDAYAYASRQAMKAYAHIIEKTDLELANGLRDWCKREELKEIVKKLEDELHCDCDFDRWEPELDTGHSCVCRIHLDAKEEFTCRKEHND